MSISRSPVLVVCSLLLAGCVADLQSSEQELSRRGGRRKDAGVTVDATATDAPTAPSALISLPVHAVLLANDDGSHRVNITASQIAQWLDYANAAYASANIQFLFDPVAGVSLLNSTLLNQMMGIYDTQWTQEKAAGNAVAANYPGHVVILFRYGPGSTPTGSAFSWTDYNFVAAPGFSNTWVCGHQNISLLGHEIGHYFGLPHTFGNYSYADLDAATTAFASSGHNLAMFDGDGYADTEPDPNIDAIQCTSASQITLDGITFAIPRNNLMAYLDASFKTLSEQQSARVRQIVKYRFGL